jgi:ketosteroid isomerase-like protein
MRNLLLIATTFILIKSQAQDKNIILGILDKQTKAWNDGDIDKFMEGYWNNDSLMFVGKNAVTYGYKNTVENYKKAYPDTAATGKLSFNILQIKKLSNEYYFVLGKWILTRTAGNLNGHYTLLFRKIKGRWVIVSDHSS